MPVWHERIREYLEAGELQVVGITQEQHQERCRLFAQWKGLGWPVLWDPFNVSDSATVPLVVAIDEHGVVRAVNPRPDTFEDDFLFREFPFPDVLSEPAGGGSRLVELAQHDAASFEYAHYRALSDLLWSTGAFPHGALDTLEAQAAERPKDGRLAFRAGVARRLRYDSDAARPGDFQVALEHWMRALAINPNQYIWRRRIQQYGPRMHKPYAFYTWVAQARDEIAARGEQPVALVSELTPAELAEPQQAFSGASGSEPDRDGLVIRDDGFLSLETAVAFDNARSEAIASVHLAFRPDAARKVHWTNGIAPLRVWLGAGGLPAGWELSTRLLERFGPLHETSTEVRRFAFDLRLPAQARAGLLKGYALFYACEDVEGTCVFLRKDFEVLIRAPR